MDRSFDTRDIVLRVLRGETDVPHYVLSGGEPKRAFTVGRKGEWKLDAKGVADHHLWLTFDGETLHASTCGGESAMLGGVELGPQWHEVSLPIELRFGRARIGISRRATQDEDTIVPPIASLHDEEERTSVHDAPTPVQNVDEEITRFDVERMNDALRRAQGASVDEEITRYEPLEPPAPAARLPEPETPAPRAVSKGSTFVPPQHTMPPARETPLPLTPPPRPPPLEPPPRPAPPAPPAPSPPSAAWPSLPPSAIGQMSSGRMSVGYERPSLAFAPLTRSSVMPATMPSDELIVARRSTPRTGTIRVGVPASVTMATPGGYELPPRLPQSEPRATASGHQPVQSVSATAQRPRSPAGERGGAQRLIADFKTASTLTKIIGGLLLPAALLGLFVYARPAVRPAPIPVATATIATAAARPSSAASITAVTPSVAPSPKPTPTATTARAAAAAAAPRDLRTPERRALDAAASGDAVAAAEQYETLAAWHPDNVAYREAARILRARAKQN